MSVLEIQDLKVVTVVSWPQRISSLSMKEDRHPHRRNGAGKSTTLRSIMGLVSITSGTITYKV
jgi:branched-chain amino acid transport system ATP-binding protein